MKQPKIRLRGYNGAWMQTTWGTLTSDFKYGINAAAKLYDGKNKYLRITDIDDTTRVFLQDNLTTPDANLSSCEEYVMQNGDIVIARTGASVGKSYIYHKSDGRVYFAGFLIRMRLKDNVDKDFIFQNTLTESYAKHIRIVSQRSGQPGVNVDELKSYSLSMPTNKKEQQTLGSYFHHLDTLIQSTAKKIESLKQVKAASLQSMFPQDGENTPRVRFRGFEGEWKRVKFTDLAEIYRGLTYSPNSIMENGVRVLRSSNIDEDSFVTSKDDVFVSSNCINVRYVKAGNILITAANGSPRLIGKHAIVKNTDSIPMVAGGFMYLVTSDESAFLNASMSSNWYSQFLKIAVAGGNGSIGNLNRKDFEITEFLIPFQREERNLIAQYFTSLDSQISFQTQRLEKLKQIKSACLDNMFV